MEPDDEERFAEALRRRAERNRREAGLPPEPDDPAEFTRFELAELMTAEFDVMRNNQNRIEEQVRRLAEVQASILTAVSEIRDLLHRAGPAPDAEPDGRHPPRP